MMMVQRIAATIDRAFALLAAIMVANADMMIVVQAVICAGLRVRRRRHVHPGDQDRKSNGKAKKDQAHANHLVKTEKNGNIIFAPLK